MGQPAATLDAPLPTESADPFTVTAPRSALTLPSTPVKFKATDAKRDGNKFTFRAPIRTNTVLDHFWWGPIVHDFDGVALQAERQPLNWAHNDWDDEDIVGYFENVGTEGSDLFADVTLLSTREDDKADTITKKMDGGVPYWFSIEFPFIETDDWELEQVRDGETTVVNGETLDGPLLVFRRWPLRGLAICRQGYDPNASAQLSAGSADQITLPGELEMLFKNRGDKAKTELAGRKAATPATPANDDAGDTTPPAAGDDAGTESPASDDAGTTTTGDGDDTTAPEAPTSVSEGGGSVSLSFEPTGDPMKDAAELSRIYADAYGENGVKYLAEGLSFEQANAREIAALRAENAEQAKTIAQLGKNLGGETDPLGSGTEPSEADKTANLSRADKLTQAYENQFGGDK